MEVSSSSTRQLPKPASLYVPFDPFTVQFDTTTENSLRTKLPACKSAAHVQRIFRTAFMGTETLTPFAFNPFIELKSRLTCHSAGDAPPLRSCHPGCQISVAVPGGAL